MDGEIVGEFKIIVGDKGYDSEETTSSPKDVASPQQYLKETGVPQYVAPRAKQGKDEEASA